MVDETPLPFRKYPPTGGGKNEPTTRTWQGMRILKPKPSVDPTQPAIYIVSVEGLRSDDVVFGVEAYIRKDRFDLVPDAKTAINMICQGIASAMGQLQSYRDCECTAEEPCANHRAMMK